MHDYAEVVPTKKLGMIVSIVLVSSLIAAVVALNYRVSYYEIPSVGNVKALGVEVYWDAACTEQCTLIDWGYFVPGETKNVTVYIKRIGNVNATLWLLSDNWNPENASEYFNLTWNREGYLMTEDVIDATITLTLLNETYFTSFSFDLIVKAVEVPYPPSPPGGS